MASEIGVVVEAMQGLEEIKDWPIIKYQKELKELKGRYDSEERVLYSSLKKAKKWNADTGKQPIAQTHRVIMIPIPSVIGVGKRFED